MRRPHQARYQMRGPTQRRGIVGAPVIVVVVNTSDVVVADDDDDDDARPDLYPHCPGPRPGPERVGLGEDYGTGV